MILKPSIAYSALYGGITGLLVLPLLLILSFCLHLVGWLITDPIEITASSIAVFVLFVFVCVWVGIVIGGFIGLCYGIILEGIKKSFHSDYYHTCRRVKHTGQVVLIISILIFIGITPRISGKTLTILLFVVYTPIFSWILLIPFILLNRKLIQLFESSYVFSHR